MSRHDKFIAYWRSLNEPPLEFKLPYLCQPWEPAGEFIFGLCEYRFAGDRHWRIRRLWIDSDFTMQIMSRRVINGVWRLDYAPTWADDYDYRTIGQEDENGTNQRRSFRYRPRRSKREF